ncbi:hypothetical protein VIGAN_03251600 [Vigna angularis var. angularis]|uniref:Uncharacterized protein n=1 Tax=Vigna angularis var. angularis TaxID=157739 RepID=A0A0S3RPL1_PHAAN|nr:hypothetical protein VIGAN_03251600 [Vigna angularis var. angularis]
MVLMETQHDQDCFGSSCSTKQLHNKVRMLNLNARDKLFWHVSFSNLHYSVCLSIKKLLTRMHARSLVSLLRQIGNL